MRSRNQGGGEHERHSNLPAAGQRNHSRKAAASSSSTGQNTPAGKGPARDRKPGASFGRGAAGAPRPLARREGPAPGTPPEVGLRSEREDEITVSVIVATHGIRGMVRGLVLTDFPDDLARLSEVIVDGQERRTLGLKQAASHGQFLLFQFEGIDTIEEAETLKGAQVKIPRDAAHPLPPGHFYVGDIIGMEVFTEDGRKVGTVQDVRRTGSNDVYYTETALIPAIRDAVTELDVPGRRMVVQSSMIVEE